MLRSVFLVMTVLFALPVLAEPFPEHTSTTVNDFADLLEPDYEARLVEVLQKLKTDTGIEMAVVTMATRDDFDAQPSFEAFATGLFNDWGIGNAAKNDGIMVLVMRNDRDMRIELGSGYSAGFDAIAGGIIDDTFLQNFKQDNYRRGIMNGVDDVIVRIATPFANGQAPPEVSGAGKASEEDDTAVILALIAAFGVLFAGWKSRKRIGDGFVRLRHCPTCGKRALRRKRNVTQKPYSRRKGTGQERTSCSNCNYRHAIEYTISPIISSGSSGSSGGSFGGGSSSGGGASGSW